MTTGALAEVSPTRAFHSARHFHSLERLSLSLSMNRVSERSIWLNESSTDRHRQTAAPLTIGGKIHYSRGGGVGGGLASYLPQAGIIYKLARQGERQASICISHQRLATTLGKAHACVRMRLTVGELEESKQAECTG